MALPMKARGRTAKPPLEAIVIARAPSRRTLVLGATSPNNDAAGYWQEFRWRCDADGESKNPKLPEIAHKPAQSANQVRHHTLASYDRLTPTEW